MKITWRDDDVGFRTKIDVLAAVDDVFQKYNVAHTIAVVASGMDKRPDLVDMILERGMIVQLHCWEHDDLTLPQFQADLPKAVDMMADLFGAPPTVLYPPWNKSDRGLTGIAASLGLTVSTDKISIEQYLRAGGDVKEDTINFHHWHVPEAILLDEAVRLSTR